MFEATCNLY